MPDVVNPHAADYFTRLRRLAQDTGVTVMIPTLEHDEPYVIKDLKHFAPPMAPSVEEYWTSRAQQARGPEPFRMVAEPSHEQTAVAIDWLQALPADYRSLFSIGNTDFSASHNAREQLYNNLRAVASTSAESLKMRLASGESVLALDVIRDLADNPLGSWPGPESYARIILAKLGDEGSLRTLAGRILTHHGDTTFTKYASEDTVLIPLGIHMRGDPKLLHEMLDRAQYLAQTQEASLEFGNVAGALYCSYDPAVGSQLTRFLSPPADAAASYGKDFIQPILHWLPRYVDIMQARPDSPQKTQCLAEIQTSVATFMTRLIDGKCTECVADQDSLDVAAKAADVLLKFQTPDHQRLLAQHMLQLFASSGSLVTSSRFEGQYLAYREQYGDLPEISSHITIR